MKSHIASLPDWLRQEIPHEDTLRRMRFFSERGVFTVCREAKCPNHSKCLEGNELTFLILGKTCTRHCRFCNVEKSSGERLYLDPDEPRRVSRVIKELGLSYVVITSVSRDDLADCGASGFVETIRLIRLQDEGIKIEVLIPDFHADTANLKMVIETAPQVVGHNLETVKRLYGRLRPESDYNVSLDVLDKIKRINPATVTKSSLMLGLGETYAEILDALADLRDRRCDIIVLGQYLAPTYKHYPVKEFISPEQFRKLEDKARGMGFKAVLAAPLARSSYRAAEVYRDSLCMN